MEFQRLTADDHDAYEKALDLYRNSFPLHEQRTAESQARIMKDAAYHFDLICEAGRWAGILLYWETEDFLYVEHFAMLPSVRGRGYGQRALELLGASGKCVILEIDPPLDAVSIRRKAFYERAGYRTNPFAHVHPPYRREFRGHRLVVMSYPARIPEAQYRAFSDYLKTVVMEGAC